MDGRFGQPLIDQSTPQFTAFLFLDGSPDCFLFFVQREDDFRVDCVSFDDMVAELAGNQIRYFSLFQRKGGVFKGLYELTVPLYGISVRLSGHAGVLSVLGQQCLKISAVFGQLENLPGASLDVF